MSPCFRQNCSWPRPTNGAPQSVVGWGSQRGHLWLLHRPLPRDNWEGLRRMGSLGRAGRAVG